MIAQLSHSEPRGRPSSSSSGVRCAGSLARNSGVVVLPHTFVSSKSSPAARTKIRAVRLFTLGGRMFSLLAAMRLSSLVGIFRGAVGGEGFLRAGHERLDGVSHVDALDVIVAPLHAESVRLEQHGGMGGAGGRLEAVRRELDQQPERVL